MTRRIERRKEEAKATWAAPGSSPGSAMVMTAETGLASLAAVTVNHSVDFLNRRVRIQSKK